MPLLIEPCTHGPWKDCLRMVADGVELRLLTEAGPRVLFLGSPGGTNLLHEAPEDAPPGPNGWRLIGGHRLWTAPEDPTRTYVPDDTPVDVERLEDGVVLRGAVEAPTGLRKALTVRMAGGAVHVRHSLEQVEGHSSRAPWAITAFAPGGRAWLPRVARRPHPDALLPDQTLVLWPYTDLGDARLDLSAVAICIDHDRGVSAPFKLGAVHPPGWLAWSRGHHVVVQHTTAAPGVRPDLGSTHEIYVDDAMTELEALGPVRTMRPGDVATLEQTWWVRRLAQPVDVVGLGRLVESLGLAPGRLSAG
jgi:hypothetical protein